MSSIQKILLAVTAFATIGEALLGPIYALYVKKIGGDLLDASGTFALFMFTTGVAIYLFGKWEDHSKHLEKFLIVGYGLSVIGYLGYIFVSSVFHLFLVQIVLGFAVALRDPAYDALFSINRKHLALAWGEWEAIYYLGLAFGAVAGGLIGTYFGFTMLFITMIGMSFLSFIATLFLLKKKYAA